MLRKVLILIAHRNGSPHAETDHFFYTGDLVLYSLCQWCRRGGGVDFISLNAARKSYAVDFLWVFMKTVEACLIDHVEHDYKCCGNANAEPGYVDKGVSFFGAS